MTMENNGTQTAALARVGETNIAAFEPRDLTEAMRLATMLVKSQLMPKHLRSAEDCLLVIMTGREMGLSIMQSIRSMHVIEGKVSLSADLIVALVKRHPECDFFRMVKSTDEEAVYETHRHGDPEPTKLTYTIKQAGAAQLTGKDNWKKHAAAMLRARCSAALARAVFPDGALGIYDTDEGEEIAGRRAPVIVDREVVDQSLEGKLQESLDAERNATFEDLMVAVLDARGLEQLEAAAANVSAAVKADKIAPHHRESLLKAYKEMKGKVS
jgi:hypothetical protein